MLTTLLCHPERSEEPALSVAEGTCFFAFSAKRRTPSPPPTPRSLRFQRAKLSDPAMRLSNPLPRRPAVPRWSSHLRAQLLTKAKSRRRKHKVHQARSRFQPPRAQFAVRLAEPAHRAASQDWQSPAVPPAAPRSE